MTEFTSSDSLWVFLLWILPSVAWNQTPVAVSDEFQVNSYMTDYQLYPSVAMNANGDFVVGWESSYHETTGWTKITSWDPEKMEAMAHHLAADFGSGLRLYETSWAKITSWDPEEMEAVALSP